MPQTISFEDAWGAVPKPTLSFEDAASLQPISEAEANQTLTPEEQTKVAGAMSWPEAFRSGAKNFPQDALRTGTGLVKTAESITPFGMAKTLYNTAVDPQSAADTLKNIYDHYAGYFSEEGLKNKVANEPAQTLVDVASIALPIKGAKAAPHAPLPKPGAFAREGAELISTGGKRMNEAKKSEVALPVEDVVPSFSGFHARLGEKGIRINKKLHPKTYDAFQEFTNFVRPKGMESAPRPATMLDLHEVRQLAANAAKDVHPGTRSPTPDAMLANELLTTIDEVIAKHPEGETFSKGSNELARGKKSESILRLIEDAKNTTQWDRGDHAGAIRNKINSFLKGPQARFLSKKDVIELKKIKRFGFTEALGGQGSLSPMALAIGRAVEMSTGLPIGSLIVAGRFARDFINTKKPQQLEGMAARIRAGE